MSFHLKHAEFEVPSVSSYLYGTAEYATLDFNLMK